MKRAKTPPLIQIHSEWRQQRSRTCDVGDGRSRFSRTGTGTKTTQARRQMEELPSVHLAEKQEISRMNGMRLTVNGEELNFSTGNTVRQLLAQLHLAGRPVAVERNGQIVPYSTFDHAELIEGDTLEVVTLVGGG